MFKYLMLIPSILSFIFSSTVSAEISPDNMRLLKGKCINKSHIAEGRRGEDLTKRRSAFYCDYAVINFFDNETNHLMVQFSESKSHTNQILGFSGNMDEKKEILLVDKVYIGQKPYMATDVACRFFFKNKKMTDIFCGGAIDIGDRRTVPMVSFKLNKPE